MTEEVTSALPPSPTQPPMQKANHITTHSTYTECSCAQWQLQKGTPIACRTCTHIQLKLGKNEDHKRLHRQYSLLGKAPQGKAPPVVKAPRPPPVQQIVLEKKYPEPHLLLAQKWTELNNIDGYWMSEKFDGVRACYNPKIGFLSRSGQLFPAPKWFSKEYPTELQLDGEFFLGRNRFASTIACCKDVENPLWSQMTFQVFDSPFLQLPFEGRLKALNDYFGQNTKTTAHVVEHHTCTGKEMVYSELKRYEKMGAEGLMLRKPKSFYVGKRSATLLKVKSFFDAEARVDEHIGGKGKYAGMMGALQCVMENGLSFKVGTGFSDKHRLQPPAIGTIITYRFQELTPDGVPRFPAFVAERLDLTTPHDALIPAVRRVREDDD